MTSPTAVMKDVPPDANPSPDPSPIAEVKDPPKVEPVKPPPKKIEKKVVEPPPPKQKSIKIELPKTEEKKAEKQPPEDKKDYSKQDEKKAPVPKKPEPKAAETPTPTNIEPETKASDGGPIKDQPQNIDPPTTDKKVLVRQDATAVEVPAKKPSIKSKIKKRLTPSRALSMMKKRPSKDKDKKKSVDGQKQKKGDTDPEKTEVLKAKKENDMKKEAKELKKKEKEKQQKEKEKAKVSIKSTKDTNLDGMKASEAGATPPLESDRAETVEGEEGKEETTPPPIPPVLPDEVDLLTAADQPPPNKSSSPTPTEVLKKNVDEAVKPSEEMEEEQARNEQANDFKGAEVKVQDEKQEVEEEEEQRFRTRTRSLSKTPSFRELCRLNTEFENTLWGRLQLFYELVKEGPFPRTCRKIGKNLAYSEVLSGTTLDRLLIEYVHLITSTVTELMNRRDEEGQTELDEEEEEKEVKESKESEK